VKDMGVDEWHCEQISGLSITNAVGAVGFIYFSKTRCGTREMWKDVIRRVVTPFILSVRQSCPKYAILTLKQTRHNANGVR
jgi:hypothetical protein